MHWLWLNLLWARDGAFGCPVRDADYVSLMRLNCWGHTCWNKKNTLPWCFLYTPPFSSKTLGAAYKERTAYQGLLKVEDLVKVAGARKTNLTATLNDAMPSKSPWQGHSAERNSQWARPFLHWCPLTQWCLTQRCPHSQGRTWRKASGSQLCIQAGPHGRGIPIPTQIVSHRGLWREATALPTVLRKKPEANELLEHLGGREGRLFHPSQSATCLGAPAHAKLQA